MAKPTIGPGLIMLESNSAEVFISEPKCHNPGWGISVKVYSKHGILFERAQVFTTPRDAWDAYHLMANSMQAAGMYFHDSQPGGARRGDGRHQQEAPQGT